MNSKLTLYVDSQYTSPYAMSAFVAFKEKGLPFELVQVDISEGALRQQDFKNNSLTNRVPTLLHNDFSLTESTAITEYLEEIFPEHAIYPKKPKERAQARQIQSWLRSDLLVIRQERSTEVIFSKPSSKPLSKEAKIAAEKLFVAAEKIIPVGAQNIFGEWCLADTDLALMLKRLVQNGDAVPERLIEYVKHQWGRASVQSWVNLKR